MPVIFWWPGQLEGGQRINDPYGTIDVFPTLCRQLNLNAEKYHLNGFDIWGFLNGNPGPKRAVFVWNGPALMSAREDRWKLHRTDPTTRPRGVKGEV